MCVCYSVACHDCKVFLDLDKLGGIATEPETEEQRESHRKLISEKPYRPGLLISFLVGHMGHSCSLLNDCDDTDSVLYHEGGTEYAYTQPFNPWQDPAVTPDTSED